MSRTQRFFKFIMPRQWFAAAEAESRLWMQCCPCGAEHSVWDAGGIRWKAKGTPQRKLRCAQCGQLTWHTVAKKS